MRGVCCWSKTQDAFAAQRIRHAQGQRGFRADDHKIHRLRFGESGYGLAVINIKRYACRDLINAGIARCA